jgi:hypothetical protein
MAVAIRKKLPLAVIEALLTLEDVKETLFNLWLI